MFCLTKDEMWLKDKLERSFRKYPQELQKLSKQRDLFPLLRTRDRFWDLNKSQGFSSTPFVAVFQTQDLRRCRDPRDRVFGLLSLLRG